MATYRCVACNLYFGTFEEQRKHYFSIHQNQTRPIPTAAPGINTINPYPKPFSSNFAPNASFIQNLNGGYTQRRTYTSKAPKVKIDPIKCEVCNVECTGQANYDLHIQGRKHIRMLNKSEPNPVSGNTVTEKPIASSNISVAPVAKPELHCDICDVSCQTIDQMKMHISGTKHAKKLKLQKYEELKLNKDPSVYCEICDQFMTEDAMMKHKESGTHKRKNTGKGENSPNKKAKMEALSVNITVEHCGFCNVNFSTHQEAVYHYQSSKHIANLQNRTKNFNLWCDICQVSFHSEEILEKHMNGFKHYAKINRGNKNPEGDLGSKLINQRLKIQALKNRKKSESGDNTDNQITIEGIQ